MRVCHLSKYYPPYHGGIETHVQNLARAQVKLGAKVDVFCVNSARQKGSKSLMPSTIEEIDEDVRVTRVGSLSTVHRFDFCPSFFTKFKNFNQENYDVVHLHTPNPTMLLHWAMAFSKVPLVITHHSDIIKQRYLKYILRPLENYVYHQASRIVTTSPKYLEGSKFLSHYKENVESLPLGIDLTPFLHPTQGTLAYAERLQTKYPGPIWLAVSRLVYYKALHIAISALTSVPGTLIIVGAGELEQSLKCQAQELGVSNRIVWLGHVSEEELVGAYYAATALWFPSNMRSEAFGIVQVESMACGCPVINAEIPHSGVPWVSRHGIEGITIPPNDSNALAQAANKLITNPHLRAKLATASQLRATQFDHLAMAQQSLDIYNQVVSTPALYPAHV